MSCDDTQRVNTPCMTGGVPQVLEGIETTHKRGVSRVPTPFFGMRQKPEFPKRYEELSKFCEIKE